MHPSASKTKLAWRKYLVSSAELLQDSRDLLVGGIDLQLRYKQQPSLLSQLQLRSYVSRSNVTRGDLS